MRHRLATAIGTLAVIGGVSCLALAQSPQPERSGRYTLHPVEGGGVLRMDNETGVLTHCVKRDGGLACDPVKLGDGQKDSEQLAKENRELKAEIKRLEDLLASGPTNDSRQARRQPKFELPSEEDVDKALGYMERMLKKFRDKMKDFEGGKSTPL